MLISVQQGISRIKCLSCKWYTSNLVQCYCQDSKFGNKTNCLLSHIKSTNTARIHLLNETSASSLQVSIQIRSQKFPRPEDCSDANSSMSKSPTDSKPRWQATLSQLAGQQEVVLNRKQLPKLLKNTSLRAPSIFRNSNSQPRGHTIYKLHYCNKLSKAIITFSNQINMHLNGNIKYSNYNNSNLIIYE